MEVIVTFEHWKLRKLELREVDGLLLPSTSALALKLTSSISTSSQYSDVPTLLLIWFDYLLKEILT